MNDIGVHLVVKDYSIVLRTYIQAKQREQEELAQLERVQQEEQEKQNIEVRINTNLLICLTCTLIMMYCCC